MQEEKELGELPVKITQVTVKNANMFDDPMEPLKRKRIPEEIEEKVDMQTKSYIDDIVSAINRDPKMKGLKPIAQKFKDLAMKTGDVAKSLKDVVTKEIGNTSILRGLTARLLNMSDSIPETQPKFDDTDKEVSKVQSYC